MADEEGVVIQCGADFIHDVPEECIASTVALTTPTDACRLALVSRDFLAASNSNVVWERFLPSDFDLMVSRSDGGEALLAEFHNKKKQLYLLLSDRPLLVDGASKSFWLEKSSGKKCWMIASRSLAITWGDTPMYWKWTSVPESRFPEVAELLYVWWLEIRGRIQTSLLSPGTQYGAYLVFNTTDEAYGLDEDEAHGAVEASVISAAGEIETRGVYLGRSLHRPSVTGGISDQFPRPRTDGWREVKIGELFTDPNPNPGEEDEVVELSVMEVKNGTWKSGLIVQGIEVRPAEAQQ